MKQNEAKILNLPEPKPKKLTATMSRHIKAIKSGTMTKSSIHALCHALNGLKNVNLGTDGIHDRQRLLNALNDRINDSGEIKITKEQTKLGINWLNKYCFKKSGEVRKTKNFAFSETEIGIIKNFSHFRFVGVYNSSESYYAYRSGHFSFHPIYRVYAKDGSYFDYTVPGLWEGPLVLEHHDHFYGF